MAEKKNVFVFQILLPLTLQVVIVSWVIYDMSSDYKKYKFFAKKFELYLFILEKRKKKSEKYECQNSAFYGANTDT